MKARTIVSRLLAPLGLAILCLLPQSPAVASRRSVDVAAAVPANLADAMSVPEDEAGEEPVLQSGRAGIGRMVQCRKICSYRVLKRRGVVISKTPTACRLECPGLPTRGCSTSECR